MSPVPVTALVKVDRADESARSFGSLLAQLLAQLKETARETARLLQHLGGRLDTFSLDLARDLGAVSREGRRSVPRRARRRPWRTARPHARRSSRPRAPRS